MITLHFSKTIKAPAANVYSIMLGLPDRTTYEKWTAVFNPTSTYEGTWETETKMLFVGTDEKGNRGGMVSEIVANTPNQFVSIKHYGVLRGDEEITEGPEVEPWAGGLENYSFSEQNGLTTLTIAIDTAEEYTEYFEKVWPEALQVLARMAEA